ncbi:MAG: phosphatase PAP2 family protein [Chitinophagia bacterium]|jgi:membrane-associated phospholipid phosphatase
MKLSAILLQAIYLVIATAALLFIGSWLTGKHAFFLMLNGDGGRLADWLFWGWTYLGDGIMWVVALLITLRYFKNRWKLTLFCLLISTLFSQTGKQLLFPAALRPAAGQIAMSEIHTVPGVVLHTNNSFPSGHTAEAFTLYLLACVFFPGRTTLLLGFCLALGVGYSRIYLAQHFPTDVAAGMLVGVVTVICSLALENILSAQKEKVT